MKCRCLFYQHLERSGFQYPQNLAQDKFSIGHHSVFSRIIPSRKKHIEIKQKRPITCVYLLRRQNNSKVEDILSFGLIGIPTLLVCSWNFLYNIPSVHVFRLSDFCHVSEK
jgi:hypothetical protein